MRKFKIFFIACCLWLLSAQSHADENAKTELAPPQQQVSPINKDAQKESLTDKILDNLDKLSPFEKFSDPGLIMGLIQFPIYSFYLGDPDVRGEAYVPNFSPHLGFEMSWKEIGISTAIALPLPKEEIDRRGRSTQANFIFHRYWRQYAIDAYYQYYRGFYIASPLTELNFDKPIRYPQLPEASIVNYGINFYYAFDSEKYSLSAAFNQSEYQSESGGSWFVMPFYNHVELKRGETFILGSDPNATQQAPDLKNSKLDSLGSAVGYGHSWVRDRYFLAAQTGLGVGVQFQDIEKQTGSDNSINPALKFNLNTAIGRNEKSVTYGARFLMDSLTSSVDGVQVYSTLISAQLFYGQRF